MPCTDSTMITICRHGEHRIQLRSRLSASKSARWHLGYDRRAPVYDRKQKAQGTIMQTNRLCDSARALRPRAARPPGDTSSRSAAPWRVGTHPLAPCYGSEPPTAVIQLMLHKLRLVPARKRTLKPYKRSAMRPTSGAAHAAMPPALMQTSDVLMEVPTMCRCCLQWCLDTVTQCDQSL